MNLATFAGGCFWCTEAVFYTLKGVEKVLSGYMGGEIENPTYEQVCTGNTGHAEVIQISFDENIISFEELMLIFFKTHNPTTLNQQGADKGTQYRSAIFYHDDKQRIAAENMIKILNENHVFEQAIVTQIAAISPFYPAEDYHQEYYLNNYRQPYCQAVIQPKLQKFAEEFKAKIKEELL